MKLERVNPSPRAGGGGGRKDGGGPESRRKREEVEEAEGGGGGAIGGGGGMKLSVREELRGNRLSLIRAVILSSSGVPGDQ